MPGPRPNATKPHSRHRTTRQVLTLPAECTLPVPPLPAGRRWSKAERELWASLWSGPQANQWDDSFITAVAQYVAHSCLVLAGKGLSWHAQEARHLGDRLGLTPQGMASLGWKLEEPEQPGAGADVVHLVRGGAS